VADRLIDAASVDHMPILGRFYRRKRLQSWFPAPRRSVYEAAVLALAEFRSCGFAEVFFGPATRLAIRVKQPETEASSRPDSMAGKSPFSSSHGPIQRHQSSTVNV